MTTVLDRHSEVGAGSAVRRLLLGLLILTTLGAAWRLCRPALVSSLSRSSIGCPYRGPLIAAGLRQSGLSLPPDRELFEPEFPHGEQELQSHSLPRPGWVAWYDWQRRESPLPSERPLFVRTLAFADESLRTRGSLTWNTDDDDIDGWDPLAWPPGDYDGDGSWEVLLRLGRRCISEHDHYVGYAVIRAGTHRNAICGYVVVDFDIWSKPRPNLRPLWQDTDGDGNAELSLATLTYSRDPLGRLRLDPPQTRAVFAWTKRSGTLVPSMLPPEGGVYVHIFAGDEPVLVEHDDDIGPVLQRLRPSGPPMR